MRISRFYCPDLNAKTETIVLPDSVHRHAVQVLRLKDGAVLRLFNGQGLEVEAVLEQVSKRRSSAKVVEQLGNNVESPLNITLLQGISRGERMDYVCQKAVELGVNRIVPVVTDRCNVQLSSGRGEKRLQHWQGVIISACEQSGRSDMPGLSEIMLLEDAIKDNKSDCRLVLDPFAEASFTTLEQQDDVSLLIGPEGGLSEQEIQQANIAGFQAVKFGPRILRTETATVAVLAVIQTMWGDLG